jgi:intracellular septation protein
MSENETFRERYLNRHIVLELLPAAVFFIVNFGWGLMVATAAVMIAALTTTVLGLYWEKKVPVLAVVTLAMVLALGGAGLIFENETFIKIKPTVGKCLFAGTLAIGLLFQPSFLARALSTRLNLSKRGWVVLTWCWIAFALSLAVVNEIVWRSLPTDTWVAITTATAPLSILGYIIITRLLAPPYWLLQV